MNTHELTLNLKKRAIHADTAPKTPVDDNDNVANIATLAPNATVTILSPDTNTTQTSISEKTPGFSSQFQSPETSCGTSPLTPSAFSPLNF